MKTFEIGKKYRHVLGDSVVQVLCFHYGDTKKPWVMEHIEGPFSQSGSDGGPYICRAPNAAAEYWDEIKPTRKFTLVHLDKYRRTIAKYGPYELQFGDAVGCAEVMPILQMREGDGIQWREV